MPLIKHQSNKMLAPAVCSLIASSTLLFFGTGPRPICWLTWLAPLPVLLIAPRLTDFPTFAIASASWFIGCLNMWHYFRGVLDLPTGTVFLILLLPSCVFGIAVLLHGRLIRRGALWQGVLVVPITWVLYEYLSSVLWAHRTFGNIAYTQMDCLIVLRLASAISVWGVSFCLLFFPPQLQLCSAREAANCNF